MKIVSVIDRELTVEEIESMNKFRTYTDGVSFACLQPRVMVMLHDEPSHDVNKLKAKALEHMKEALSEHPDFTVYNMDDGHVLVFLNSGIFAFSKAPCKENMTVNMALRSLCLDAAEKMEIVAVAYEED
jgi:hypothetical protein